MIHAQESDGLPTQALVSIAIPTYNGAKRIEKAIRSALSQPYQHIELIISDNASTDSTQEICEAWVKKDPRVRYYRQAQNMGVTPNFENGLQKAQGEFFMWMADDDELIPGVIQHYVEFLVNSPEHSLVCGKINYWENNQVREQEAGLSFEQARPLRRTLSYYKKVKEGALIYGMMRTRIAQRLRLRPIIGNDWHFVASLAFLGKIRQLDFVGYNKSAGGVSVNFHNYVRVFGERKIWGYFPYIKLSLDSFREIMYRGQIFQSLNGFTRFGAAMKAGLSVFSHYYFNIYPRIYLGKVLRFLKIKTPRQRRAEKLQSF